MERFQIPPPPKFDFTKPEEWPKWIRRFERFRIASGLELQPDENQIVLMTKIDEACPLVQEDLQKVYVSSYIEKKVQEVSSRLGVPVSCVLPVKNYSQELELNLSCDLLLLTAVKQMLNFAEDYLDDAANAH